MKLILASKSPRRREILGAMGYSFAILTSEADETLPDGTSPRDGVELLAIRKGEAVAPLVDPDAVILSSDTLVDLDGVALGKPEDEEDAFRMLKALSGAVHFVHTGVAVIYKGRILSDVDTTAVQFCRYTPTEAWTYVLTGEPMDKAGAYGIQGLGRALVEKREGNLDTVIGFPTLLCDRMLKSLFTETAE